MLEVCFILLLCNMSFFMKKSWLCVQRQFCTTEKQRRLWLAKLFSLQKLSVVTLWTTSPNFGPSGSWSLNVKQKPTTMDKEIMNFNGPATTRNQKSSVTKTELDVKKTYIDSTINLTEILPENPIVVFAIFFNQRCIQLNLLTSC